jgi:hypothetical protein
MLDNIKALPVADKKTLLALLQVDLGITITTSFKVNKESFYQLETRKCNRIAEVKKAGGQVIFTDLQMVD